MKQIRQFLVWYGLLTRRLFRRPGYLAVLLLVPLLTLALMVASRQDSGVITIALCCQGSDDPIASAAVERLTGEKSILRFVIFEQQDAARDAVLHTEADAAWIFQADLAGRMDAYAAGEQVSLVSVIQREDNVFLRLSREKLYAAVYPELSYTLFSHFLNGLSHVPETEDGHILRSYYESGVKSDEILRFAYADGEKVQNPENYLVAPVRGMLSLLVVLCGLASGMYCFQEEREERFAWLRPPYRRMLPLLCHMTAILPAGAAALVSLAWTGMVGNPAYELLLMLCFAPAAAGFCELIRALCPGEVQFGALIPVLMIVMLAACPVFVNIGALRPLQRLLPPYYYLNAVHDFAGCGEMLAYALAASALSLLLSRLMRRS